MLNVDYTITDLKSDFPGLEKANEMTVGRIMNGIFNRLYTTYSPDITNRKEVNNSQIYDVKVDGENVEVRSLVSGEGWGHRIIGVQIEGDDKAVNSLQEKLSSIVKRQDLIELIEKIQSGAPDSEQDVINYMFSTKHS